MADESAVLDGEDTEAQKKPPVPLGMYAPFDVSDQKEWTKADLDGASATLNLATVIRTLVVAACQRESLARRLEIEQAWRLQLMDRGFHRLIPLKRGGWSIAYQNTPQGIFGGMYEANLHDVNVIGVHNDIIVNSLNREQCKTEFSPRGEDDKAVTAAALANKIKYLIADDACFKDKQREAARLACTDERIVFYMRPVADAQRLGFEDDAPDVAPETEGDVPESQPSKRPIIQTELEIVGKLEHKCRIAEDESNRSPYDIIAKEYDTASLKAEFPWIADKIQGGSAGIAEIELDRVARASIKIAIQGGMVTGQGNRNDTTKLRAWITPAFYWNDTCPEAAREWLLETFPKGFLAVYAATELAFVRNESSAEVLTVVHARSGKGQNRRALTEAYAGPNMILDNLFDLIVKFFTSTVPRTYYDSKVFNVPQLRQSGNVPGRKEPFKSELVNPNSPPILNEPLPAHQPALPDFIHWLSGELAQLLTGAQLTLQGANNADGEQGTLGEAQMDNASAMTRMSEPWGAMCKGLSESSLKAVKWNARVQPPGKVFERVTKEQGRIRVEMENLDAERLTLVDTNGDFPESWTDREQRVWQMISQMPTNPFLASIVMQPANARIVKDAARMGITIPGAASWEKQEGEFALLLAGQPQPNPQIAALKIQIQKFQQMIAAGTAEMAMYQQQGQQPDPDKMQALQQAPQILEQLNQQMQQLPPLVSSVPVRADGSEEDAIEEACCLERMISAEGRRLATSKDQNDQLAFANLHLHWFEHRSAKEKLAAANMQPVEPKASMTMDVSKMPGEVQSQILQKYGIAVAPETFNQMGPHELVHTVEGVNASGAEEKIETKLSGKALN